MKLLNLIILMGALFFVPAMEDGVNNHELDNIFYCFNNGVRTLPNAPEGVDSQAALVKELGFDGLAGHREETYYDWRKAMDAVNLSMPEMYIGLNVGKDGKAAYHEDLKNILKDSAHTGLLMALHLHNDSGIEDRQKVDRIFVEGLQELADFCHPLGIKIAVYPHVGFYCEKISHAVKLSEAVNRRNVGVVFNMCHFWKVEGSKNWKEAIQLARPYLFMVSINGIDDADDTKALGWDRLIQPLGEGTFDTYELVEYVKGLGYDGLFGLQCYGIKQDCKTALTKSMDTWKSYKQRYRQESKQDF
jgi:sugar phosphate isomerase/epimerase